MAKCSVCGTPYREPEDEQGDHDCPKGCDPTRLTGRLTYGKMNKGGINEPPTGPRPAPPKGQGRKSE